MAQLDETIVATQSGHIYDHIKLHKKANYVFDVKDYGAVGDGVTDDSAAIQAAIDGAAAGGGTVFFPKGIYRCDTTLNANHSNIVYRGVGRGASLLRNYVCDLFSVGGKHLVFEHLQ